ncbi:phosphatidate cytidylyltransferase [Thermodesulfobacteriota bacterium]
MSKKRVVSALSLIPVIMLFIYFAEPILWLALILGVGYISQKEYFNMAAVKIENGEKTFAHILNACLIATVYFSENVSLAIFIAFFVVATKNIIKTDQHKEIVNHFLSDLLGAIYCAILPSYFLLIRMLDGKEYIYLLLLTIWAIDAGAYYVGCSIGRHKLIPHISPNKTIEGSLGGMLSAVCVIVGAKILYFTNFSLVEAVLFGIYLAIIAQIGDLFESLLKRAAGIKDSGDVIPGHGGMLDRVDSLLFAAPAFFYFTLYLTL